MEEKCAFGLCFGRKGGAGGVQDRDAAIYRPHIGIGRYLPLSVASAYYRYRQIKLTLTDGSSQYLYVVDRHTFCVGYVGVLVIFSLKRVDSEQLFLAMSYFICMLAQKGK